MSPIKEFNDLKKLLIARGNSFTKKEFLNLAKTINGLPKYPSLFSCLQPEILFKVSHGNRRASEPATYAFKSSDPVYYACLDRAIEKCLKQTKKYKKTHYENCKNNAVIPVVEILDPINEIQKAIDLLKSHGYKILKPQYTEV